MRILIRSIRGSPKRREKLRMACQFQGIEELKPILDVSTRWNSTFEMCNRAVMLQTVLDTVTLAETDLRQHVLNDDEWETIKLLVKVLKPFKDG